MEERVEKIMEAIMLLKKERVDICRCTEHTTVWLPEHIFHQVFESYETEDSGDNFTEFHNVMKDDIIFRTCVVVNNAKLPF